MGGVIGARVYKEGGEDVRAHLQGRLEDLNCEVFVENNAFYSNRHPQGTAMNAVRILAILLGLSLMIGEAWRSWGTGRPIYAWMDDMVMGGALILAAVAYKSGSRASLALLASGWGANAGMLYGSFFGKIFNPAEQTPGNWDLGVLTWLVGAAFITSLAGLIATAWVAAREARF